MAQDRDAQIRERNEKVKQIKDTNFVIGKNGALMINNRICIPRVDKLREEIMEEAHNAPYSMHLGTTKMYQTIKTHYWWPTIKKDVAKHVAKCMVCKQIKVEHQTLTRKLRPLPIPEWKWEQITMDFMHGLPLTLRKHDAIWLIMDRLTKFTHFLPIKRDYSLNKLARMSIDEIVRLHGVPLSIVSDRDPHFTSHFFAIITRGIGNKITL